MTETEWTLQYRFSKNGQWLTQDSVYYTLHDAKKELDAMKNIDIEGFAKYWRIVSREVTPWKKLKEI